MRHCVTLLLLACVATTCQLPAAAANGSWFEVRSPNFTVLTDSGEKQAIRVASQLERMRAVFHQLIPSAKDSAGSPIIVLALKNKADFQALEPAAYLAKGSLNLAGYFMRAPDKNYILLRLDADGDHPYATIYHEYTHYIMRDSQQWIPLWMNEGLAQYYQNSDIRDKDVLLGKPNADDILYLRENRIIPLKTLFAVDATSPYYHEEQKGSVFYAESWALTHLIEMTDWKTHAHRLRDYASLLMNKTDPAMAAQQAFGDLNELQRQLQAYISYGNYQMLEVKTAVTIDESSFHSSAISSADANAIRADVLVYNQRTAEAQSLINAVLQQDPKNALAHETMGFLKFHEGDVEGARKWYGDAVELDSQSYLAHYYYAVMTMRAGDWGKEAQIESNLRASLKLNPNFAPAYDALASVVSRDPERARDAHLLNVQAIGLEPDNVNYRLNTAYVLINTHHYTDAMSVLSAATHVAKTPEEVQRIQAQIDQLQQYQDAANRQRTPETIAATAERVETPKEATRGALVMKTSDGRQYVLKESETDGKAATPADTPAGPKHTVSGVLRNVKCAYPSRMTLTVERSGAPPMTLYINNFFVLQVSATNFTPSGDLNPCTDLEDAKAKVEYSELAGKGPDGQIVSIALSK